jgi:hypothetical protein
MEIHGTQIWMLKLVQDGSFRGKKLKRPEMQNREGSDAHGSSKEEISAMVFKLGVRSEFAVWTSEDGSNNLAIQSTSQKVATRRK